MCRSIPGGNWIPRPESNAKTNARASACYHVICRVADDCRAQKVKVEIVGGLQDHARLGLAPRMIPSISTDSEFRMIRAVIDFGDRRVLFRETITHPTRQMVVCAFVKKPSPNARLVGDDDEVPAQVIDHEARQFENSGHELELIRTMDRSTIDVDDAVPIEKEGFPPHDDRVRDDDPLEASKELSETSGRFVRDAKSFNCNANSLTD